MASLGRWSLAGGVIALTMAGCASIAGLEDPSPPREAGAPGAPDVDATVTLVDAAAPEADVDDAGACTKKATDQSCSAGAECCSGACTQARKCAASCKSETQSCSSDCCIGFYCKFTCLKCIPAGTSADTFAPFIPLPESCCSGHQTNGRCD